MTRSRRLEELLHATERVVAPHVEATWAEAVLLELRLRGVSGERIGSVLAEVDAHCADSGQSAAEAFGDPGAYARSLDLPTDGSRGAVLAASAPVLVQVAGLLAVQWGLTPWLAGEPLDLTVGLLAVAATVVAAVVAVLLSPDRALRLAVELPVALVGVVTGIVAIQVALLILLDGVVASVPAQPVTLLGLALLVGGQVAVLRRPTRLDDDPVTHPLADPTAPSSAATAGRVAMRLLEVGARWSLPLAALALSAMSWLLHTLA